MPHFTFFIFIFKLIFSIILCLLVVDTLLKEVITEHDKDKRFLLLLIILLFIIFIVLLVN